MLDSQNVISKISTFVYTDYIFCIEKDKKGIWRFRVVFDPIRTKIKVMTFSQSQKLKQAKAS